MKIIDLSGVWTSELGDVKLPGSTCEAGIGKKQEYYDEYSIEAIQAAREKYEYIGPITLEREIEISEDDASKAIYLYLARVNYTSSLKVDGEAFGRPITSLSAPHVYNLTGALSKGEHKLSLTLDNRNELHLGDMASGYSIDTQGYWNGAVGEIKLLVKPLNHIDELQVFPEEDGVAIDVIVASDNHIVKNEIPYRVRLEIYDDAGELAASGEHDILVFTPRARFHLKQEIKTIKKWDEFHPNMYKIKASLIYENEIIDCHETDFGIRYLRTEGTNIILNDRPISLRGTIECAQFPLTGYPDMDEEAWIERMKVLKEYGLNHMRCHAWCPPEAAFRAADKIGIYLVIEMPLWMNLDVHCGELGLDMWHEAFFTAEMKAILRSYGNHPSFICFSCGNENLGDFTILEDLITMGKALDNRHLYTQTSNFDHPLSPKEDYFSAFEIRGDRVRIQTMHDEVAKGTFVNYDKAVKNIDIPAITFEVGQYCVYPDVKIVEDYHGNMMATNFDVVRKGLTAKGNLDRLNDYIKASGTFGARLYKEDIEAALRTKNLGGFQLLSLYDYTGQKTATVGILDIFLRNKGFISADEWKSFCGPVVPLMEAKRIFSSDEKLEMKLGLYDMGELPIESVVYKVRITKLSNDGAEEVFKSFETSDECVSVDLSEIKESSRLKIYVKVNEFENSWRIFVMVPNEVELPTSIVSIKTLNQPEMKGRFKPIFWSPAHFPQETPCGAMIKAKHPALKYFPTDDFIDYQWKYMLDNGKALILDGVDNELYHILDKIVEFVPGFVKNTKNAFIFECIFEGKKTLFTGIDLEADDVCVKVLKESLVRYVNSDDFNPSVLLSLADFSAVEENSTDNSAWNGPRF